MGLVLVMGVFQEILQSMRGNGSLGSAEFCDPGVDLLAGLAGVGFSIWGRRLISS